MPLTSKGEKILHNMEKPKSEGGYGPKKGESVFYASKNKGTIKGVEGKDEEEGGKKLIGLSGGNVGLQPVFGGSRYAKDADKFAKEAYRKKAATSRDIFGSNIGH